MKKYTDDGRTIYPMNGVGSPAEMKRMSGEEKKSDKERVSLTRKERFAAIRAGFAVFFPRVLMILGCFAAVALLLYFWLK